MTTLSDHVSTLSDHVSTLSDHVPTLSDHVPTLTDHVPTLSDHVTRLTDHVPTLTNHVTTLTHHVTTLNYHVTILTAHYDHESTWHSSLYDIKIRKHFVNKEIKWHQTVQHCDTFRPVSSLSIFYSLILAVNYDLSADGVDFAGVKRAFPGAEVIGVPHAVLGVFKLSVTTKHTTKNY